MTDSPIPLHEIDAQAVLWVVRVGDAAFADWEEFEQWLATDPVHAAAYHRAATDEAVMIDRLMAARAIAPAPVKLRARMRSRLAPWLGGALAASLVLAVGFAVMRPAAPPAVYETAPGGHREVILTDGSHIALNGGTRLTVAAKDPRAIRLERGEALFTVHHDPSRPFSVAVANAAIVDVGTVFNVVREARETRVAVAEGAVVWNPKREAVRLEAGQQLRARDGDPTLTQGPVDVSAVGGWTRGQLSYDGAPLVTVAADVSRALGVTVTVSPTTAQHRVYGVVRLDGGADMVLPRLGALLGVRAHREGAVWSLSSPS
jgi:transmembrane sensor